MSSDDQTCQICYDGSKTALVHKCHFCKDKLICKSCLATCLLNDGKCPFCQCKLFHKDKVVFMKYAKVCSCGHNRYFDGTCSNPDCALTKDLAKLGGYYKYEDMRAIVRRYSSVLRQVPVYAEITKSTVLPDNSLLLILSKPIMLSWGNGQTLPSNVFFLLGNGQVAYLQDSKRVEWSHNVPEWLPWL